MDFEHLPKPLVVAALAGSILAIPIAGFLPLVATLLAIPLAAFVLARVLRR